MCERCNLLPKLCNTLRKEENDLCIFVKRF
jgi:hypothetical protein